MDYFKIAKEIAQSYNKDLLYQKQVELLTKASGGEFTKTAFVDKDFICFSCKKDLLSHKSIQDNIKNNQIITGCPFCNRSFCS